MRPTCFATLFCSFRALTRYIFCRKAVFMWQSLDHEMLSMGIVGHFHRWTWCGCLAVMTLIFGTFYPLRSILTGWIDPLHARQNPFVSLRALGLHLIENIILWKEDTVATGHRTSHPDILESESEPSMPINIPRESFFLRISVHKNGIVFDKFEVVPI